MRNYEVMSKIDFSQWTDPTDVERNELVFEKRNKAYGAYAIRKNYNKTLVRALVFSVFIILSLFMIPKITMLFAKETIKDEWKDVPWDMTPPEPTKKEEVAKVQEEKKLVEKKSDTRMLNIWKEITDGIANIDTLTVDDINKLVTGVINNPDEDSTGIELFPYLGDLDSGDKIVVDKIESPLIIVPEMPEFIGGEPALFKFLKENLEFPEYAKEQDKSARVLVGFVVEKDGSISSIKILSCSEKGFDFETEATRVISNMPRWKPGRQNGHPVRVMFNIPIIFRLM